MTEKQLLQAEFNGLRIDRDRWKAKAKDMGEIVDKLHDDLARLNRELVEANREISQLQQYCHSIQRGAKW